MNSPKKEKKVKGLEEAIVPYLPLREEIHLPQFCRH